MGRTIVAIFYVLSIMILTVLLVQATFSLEEREKDLLGSHLYSYQVW